MPSWRACVYMYVHTGICMHIFPWASDIKWGLIAQNSSGQLSCEHCDSILCILTYQQAQFISGSRSVVSDSLWSHGLQHTRLPCPSPTLRACSNSGPLSWWCHPTFLSTVVPFSSCLHSFPASGSFTKSQFFSSGGQSTGVSASTSVLPVNIQDWFPLGWTGWISLPSKGLSRVISNVTVQKHQFFGTQLSL